MFKDDGAAFIFMVLLAIGLSLAVPIPYYLGWILSGAAPFSAKWLCLSPAYAPYLVSNHFGPPGALTFWIALAVNVAWSGVCLGLACFFLNRNWRNDVRGASQSRWRDWLDAWLHGSRAWRAGLRNKLLPVNPFQWLVQQDRQPLLLGGCTIGLICLLWVIGWRTWPRAWPSNANFFVTALVLITTVNWLALFAAARRVGTDRRDGILELLLTTPLSPQEMVDGEIRALEAEFKPLRIAVLGFLVLMMAGGFTMRSWNVFAAITYAAIWCALFAWCLSSPKGRILEVMWAALNSGRPVYSMFRWRGNKWSWYWILFNMGILGRRPSGGGLGFAFPSGSTVEFTLLCAIGIPVGAFYYLGRTVRTELQNNLRRRLMMDMRLIATEPLPDPNDPAFKYWDGVHRLQYRAHSTPVGVGWPVFADAVETDVQPYGHATAHREVANAGVTAPLDALALFQLLRERTVKYSMVGGLAVNAYLANRNIKDADVLMSASELERLPELHIQEWTDFFICAQFRTIRVVIYLTADPFFEAVQVQFPATVAVAGKEVPSVTVEGLIALNLYAIHLISRQREFYRNERYEVDMIALLASQQNLSLEPVLTLIRAHVPEQHLEELENTLETCREAAARARKRANRTNAFSAFGAPVKADRGL